MKTDNKCSSLQPGENVVFYVDVYHEGKEEIYDGNVISVNHERQTVDVLYLEGYHSRNDAIPFAKMIAKYDKDGEEMKFGAISGRSVLLIPN